MVSRDAIPAIVPRFAAACLVASRPPAGCLFCAALVAAQGGVGAGNGATVAVGVRTGRLVVGRGRLG